jgi:response regulator RpfG family c-di-GMP phosphodiesterase
MKKVLFVDDDPNILAALQRQLRRDFQVETAPGPNEALEILKDGAGFAVVVADMRMPEMDGVEFLVKVRQQAPDVVRMMLTGNADQATAVEAVNSGRIFRFLNKPCESEVIAEALKASIQHYELVHHERELLEKTLNGTIHLLTEILAVNDPKAFTQAQQLRDNTRMLVAHLHLERAWEYEAAASLAQIGQAAIPREVMLKVRVGHTLTPKEQDMFTRIPSVGSQLLSAIPRMENVCKMILYQNKKYDGTGYPQDNVCGPDIVLGARILKALGDLLQLESEGVARAAALDQMRLRKGWYDAVLLEAIAECFKILLAPICKDGKKSVPLAFGALQVGHILVSDIETKEGILIVSKGNKISPALIHRLRNFASLSGIREPIFVEPWSWHYVGSQN